MSKSLPQSLSPEAELTHSLLALGNSYPWNPADLEAESYFQRQEDQSVLQEWSEEDVQQAAASFFAKLNKCWPDTPIDLINRLCQQFATQMPRVWLEKIAAEVTQIASQKMPTANQLVSCVKELMPNWEEEDLLVLARPYSYAMRSNPSADSINNLAQPIDWLELSEMDQAKLTMLVTKYALDQIADQTND
jgi:hypothetical protein